MNLRPVEASEYLSFEPAYQSLLKEFGCVVVNDKLLPVWKFDYDILLLFGGRGGGKSEAECDALLKECIDAEYFKCYYGRKVFDTVRGSCFATLIYCIKKNKLEHLFSYSEADSSSMIITCISNGNKFIPFGADKADKLKSIKDPTHIWCEEFDQFSFNDFKELYPTLRTIRGINRFIGTFNTHGVLPNHWILKIFFPDLYEGTDKDDALMVNLLKGKRVKKIFVNYPDNYFIDQESYKDVLMIASGGNLTIFEGLANGSWGIVLNDSPWLFAWDAGKHMAKQELFAIQKEILYLSWDFNRNPQACTVIQWYNETVYILDVVKEANVGTEGICERILLKYPMSQYLYVITGDYSGDTVSSIHKEQVTNYSMIKTQLKLSEGQIKTSPNPRLEKNRTLVNAIFYRYKVQVCPVKARPFKFDAENVKQSPEGKIEKDDRKDPAKQADVLDTVRYFLNQFLGWFIQDDKK
ncbi:MAG: phage terminase, large subunit, family [Chitinophagaceae bacterium]|nr:phage terminase, large subunit, family [Chitinophagaceae bacterium]